MAHYSNAHRPAAMRAWAKVAADKLRGYAQQEGRIPVLCYQGMSGIASAAALAAVLAEQEDRGEHPPLLYGMVYVRKEGEGSHGEYIEISEEVTDDLRYNKTNQPFVAVFVDDFIVDGHTFNRVMGAVEKAIPGCVINWGNVLCLMSGSPGLEYDKWCHN